ncbi:MAG: NAD(P)/FAD-dependent oxidoreductase [Aquabacterium sp.]|nr:MAG: NAD(P)/FAD-dependent oxidoreductase [Aquabacterium sp.]
MSGARAPSAIVVGAGPAGLAVAACLKQQGLSCTILEQANTVGWSWRNHYERLHLHTDKAHSELPGLPFPKTYPRYPSRRQVVEYLEAYARHHDLQPRLGQRVLGARLDGDGWEVRTADSLLHAGSLVVAGGYNNRPNLPTWPAQESFRGRILHSSEYRSGADFHGQRVLVVGLGNSGGEIAIDLWEQGARTTSLAVRSPVNVIPKEVFGVPFLTVAISQRRLPPPLADALNAPLTRALVGNLEPYGLKRPAQGPVTQILRLGRVPFIDTGTIKLIKQGQVKVFPGIQRFVEDGVVFTDGRRETFDAVVLATGFRPAVGEWLHDAGVALDQDGAPAASGRESARPGLYFCGYYVSPTGMLREIALEAQAIAKAVAERQRAVVPA